MVLFIYFSSQLCCCLRSKNSPQTHWWEGFLVFGNFSLFKDSLPETDLHSYLFCLSFYLLYIVLPPFEDNALPLWVPDVLCQHSKVVLWNLLSIQMFFRWIFGGESGLPILFLCHLRTTPCLFSVVLKVLEKYNKTSKGNESKNWKQEIK